MRVRFLYVQIAALGLFLASAASGGEQAGELGKLSGNATAFTRSTSVKEGLPSADVYNATPTGITGVWSVSAIRATERVPAVFLWSDEVQTYGQRRGLTGAGSVHEASVIRGELQRSNGTREPIVAVLVTLVATGETKLVMLQAFDDASAAKAYFRGFQRNPSLQNVTDPHSTRWSCLDCRAACDGMRDASP